MDKSDIQRIRRDHALQLAVQHAGVAPTRRDLPTGDEVVENARKFYAFLNFEDEEAK